MKILSPWQTPWRTIFHKHDEENNITATGNESSIIAPTAEPEAVPHTILVSDSVSAPKPPAMPSIPPVSTPANRQEGGAQTARDDG